MYLVVWYYLEYIYIYIYTYIQTYIWGVPLFGGAGIMLRKNLEPDILEIMLNLLVTKLDAVTLQGLQ